MELIGYLGKATPSGREILDYAAKTVRESPHQEIHAGRSYLSAHSSLADNTDVIEVFLQTSNSDRRAHMTMDLEAALAATVEIWLTTTKTYDAGNIIAKTNREMESANVSPLLVCHTPGGAQAGTADLTQYIGSASANGKGTIGGSAGGRNELILPKNRAVLVRMTSRANLNAMTIFLDWYEHDISHME